MRVTPYELVKGVALPAPTLDACVDYFWELRPADATWDRPELRRVVAGYYQDDLWTWARSFQGHP